ncbi:MAG: hypothetical protein RLT05_01060 [Bauldia litoralis]
MPGLRPRYRQRGGRTGWRRTLMRESEGGSPPEAAGEPGSMQRASRLRFWVLVSAIAATAAGWAGPAGAETGVNPPAAHVVPVREPYCEPRRTCWRDHWGVRRCFRRWICSDDAAPDQPVHRRYPLERDFAPEAGIDRDREPSLRRYRQSADPDAPEIVRPERRAAPRSSEPGRAARIQRQRVPKGPRSRLKDIPGRDPETAGKEDRDRPVQADRPGQANQPAKPEAAVRQEELAKPKTSPDRAREVEIVPRSTPNTGKKEPAPETESARLKEPPPVPAPPRADTPARINPAPLRPRLPASRAPAANPNKRKAEKVPDDIDKLPRGRKIPMDEIEPPKPKKKLPPRLRI